MELDQLRCFLAVAENLHFGRAAHRLEMQPAALGRQVRLLEEDLGVPLFLRTTRHVMLTEVGAAFVDEARDIITKADTVARHFRAWGRQKATSLRLGAIDTAAAGLVPVLLHDFRSAYPDIAVELIEDKTIRLLPRLLSGRLDLALIRPPEYLNRQIEIMPLFNETVVVAVPVTHPLARRKSVTIASLANEPLIVPDRRSRPHSHAITVKLFEKAGLRPSVVQIAGEKQTIINLVAAGIGAALLPRWTSRMAVTGVRYLQLKDVEPANILPLAVAWLRGSRDSARDQMLKLLQTHVARYAEKA